MKYYIYFDGYSYPRQAITQSELEEKFQNDADEFLKAMLESKAGNEQSAAMGHVGCFAFKDKDELEAFLSSTDDDLAGYYGCRSHCEP